LKTTSLSKNHLNNPKAMATHNKILKRYLKNIALFFAYDWIILSVSIITFGYFLINYFFKDSFKLFDIPRMEALIGTVTISIIFISKFFISSKLKARLIIEIIEDSKYYSLIVYNKSLITVDKAFIPLNRQEGDIFTTNLFGGRMSTINLGRKSAEIFIVKIDNKKYYLVPPLFESEVLI